MINPASLEEAVLALLCYSTDHAPLLALKITEPRFFSNQVNQKIAQTALNFVTSYGTPPKGQIEYLLENDFIRGEQGKLLRQTVEGLSKVALELEPSFILEELDKLLEKQRLTSSLQQALVVLEEGDNEKAKELIHQAQMIPQRGTAGLWMRDSRQALSFLDKDDYDTWFSSGVDTFDDRGLRPDRKTLTTLMASTGKGKTWWLIAIGKAALQHHHKVLHITLELSQEKTARRYIQSIFGLTKDQVRQIKVPYFQKDEFGNLTIDFNEFQREGVITKRNEIRNKLDMWFSCPDWVIKEFPTSTLSTEHLDLYVDSLEREKGFKPDIVIIDYADLMKIDTEALRIDTGRLYKELRGWSMSRNHALVTATQGNKESENAKLVGLANVSEDWSKMGTSDFVFSFSQTIEEFRLGLARLYACKGRDEADRILVLISQAYGIGQFCIDSTIMNANVINEMQRIGAVKS